MDRIRGRGQAHQTAGSPTWEAGAGHSVTGAWPAVHLLGIDDEYCDCLLHDNHTRHRDGHREREHLGQISPMARGMTALPLGIIPDLQAGVKCQKDCPAALTRPEGSPLTHPNRKDEQPL
jgi:hypothetical protein